MADNKLEALLSMWGREYGGDYREEPRRWHRTASHPIAQSMQFAPGKHVKRATRAIVGRGGYERRLIMGAAAGRTTARGIVLPIPMDYVDPVPCKAGSRGGGGGHGFRPVPPALQKVEKAVLAMEEFALIRALCVRVQYAGDGEHKDKFAKVNEKLREISKGHEGISLARYRDELTYARVWLHGALLEVLAAA